MKISLKWLKDYIEPDLDNSQISDALTSLGLECNITSSGLSFSDVVLGKLLEVTEHSDSDHLKICMKCGSDATTRYSVSNQQWFIGCSTFPQCWWKYSLPKYLGDGLFETMSDARYI